MNKKTVTSTTSNTILKLRVLAKKKEGTRGKLVVTAKKLATTAREKESVRGKLAITAETLRLKAKQLAVLAKEKESIRSKLEVTAKQLAGLAKEKEDVRNRLAVTAEALRLKAKQLATTAKEKEGVRSKLVITAETLRLKAEQLALTAKERESIRSKLEVTAKKLATTAKERESVRGKLAVTAETLRLKAKQLAVTAKKIGSANKYARSLIESSLDPLVTISPEGKITDVNKATIKVTGASREKLIGTDFLGYFTEPQKARHGYQHAFKYGLVADYPLTIKSKIGKLTDVLFNAAVYKDEKNNVLGVFAAARDVTDAKKAKELLAVTAEKLANTAKEKESVRTKLAVVAKKLAVTAKEKENVRQRLVVTAKQLKDKATQLAITAKEKEDVRNKLVVTAKELATTAKKTELINKELRTLDIAKDEFVSIASHQLRTPLTALKGYTSMLLDGDAGPVNDKQHEYLTEIENANNRMIGLITALLNVSRVDLGVFIVEPEQVDLQKVAESALNDLNIKIKSKKLQVETNFGKDVPLISADLNITQMIFQNLFSNAVKYTPSGGKINISTKKSGSNIIIMVADTGYGIPQNVQSKIFTKMFRADNARVKDPEGSGLGLYIIKSTLEKTGGKIWFESAENKGSTFYVTIPLAGMKKKEGTKRLELK